MLRRRLRMDSAINEAARCITSAQPRSPRSTRSPRATADVEIKRVPLLPLARSRRATIISIALINSGGDDRTLLRSWQRPPCWKSMTPAGKPLTSFRVAQRMFAAGLTPVANARVSLHGADARRGARDPAHRATRLKRLAQNDMTKLSRISALSTGAISHPARTDPRPTRL